VPVDPTAIGAAETRVVEIAEGLRQRDFTPKPELSKCRACDVQSVCRAAKLR
jgi:DNA helicase-2/ATP-dependent DNA helicase PcrA